MKYCQKAKKSQKIYFNFSCII